MPTVRDICKRALKKIGAEDSTVEGEDMADALDAYNAMLHAWKLQSVDVGHVDQSFNDTFLLDDEFIEGTVYVLASRLSPDYEIPQFFDADAWWRAIQTAYVTIEPVTIDAGLEDLPSQRYRRYF